MDESNNFFNCQNNDCILGIIDTSEPVNSDKDFPIYNCPDCEQSYIIHNNREAYAFFYKQVFKSFDDFRVFTDKHGSARLYISELILENIDKLYLRERIEFKKCIISSLLIENLDLHVPRSPFNFVDCTIERLYIRNSKIERGIFQDSLETQFFFGINIIRSSISEEFEITEVNSNICISDSVVDCPIRVEKSIIPDFGLFHNPAAISFETDDLSELHTRTSELISGLPKEDAPDLTSAKTIRDVEIQELLITPDIKGEIKLKGVHIKKLIFQNDSEVHARINFEDCLIDKILNCPKDFKEDVQFYNCTFSTEVNFSRCTFQKSFTAEACTFKLYLTLYEITVQNNIRLNYSLFEAGIEMNESRFNAYVFMSFAICRGDMVFGNLLIHKDLVIYADWFKSWFEMHYCNVRGTVILSKTNFYKDASLDANSAKKLEVELSEFNGKTKLLNQKIEYIHVSHSVFFHGVSMIAITENKLSIKGSLFHGDLEMLYCELDDCSVYNNIFLGGILFDRLEAENLQVQNNIAYEFTINSGIYNEITIDKNTIWSYSWISFCKFKGNVVMLGNHFKGPLYINKNVAHQDFEFIDNQMEKEGLTRIIRNDFYNFNIEGSDFSAPLLMYDNRLQAKLSIGSQPGKGSAKRVVFHLGASLSNNRIRTFNMFNVWHAEAFCFMNNHLEGDFYLKEGIFYKELDLSGSYIGGSMRINNIGAKQFTGNLILDDVFVDKRISLKNTSPEYLSFVDAKLNGLNIPDNWQMIWFKLKDTLNGKYILADDANKQLDPENPELSYQLLKTYFQTEYQDFINEMQNIWDDLHFTVFNEEEEKSRKFIKEIEIYDNLFYYRHVISDILKLEFMTVYYGIIEEGGLDLVLSWGAYFETFNTDSTGSDDPEISKELEKIKSFFETFINLCTSFRDRKVPVPLASQVKFKQYYKRNRRSNLMNQYLNLRQIYAENGELGNEDKAYYKWMHYKTLLHMSSRKRFAKAISVLKLLVFETIFGWGVALWRIVISTIATVFLFSGIYSILFEVSPSFKMQWDGAHIPAGTIGYAKILLFSLQTTFGAFTGEWDPIGSLGIKLLMTINTVLGVLFVTFLIGAYGRKMLR